MTVSLALSIVAILASVWTAIIVIPEMEHFDYYHTHYDMVEIDNMTYKEEEIILEAETDVNTVYIIQAKVWLLAVSLYVLQCTGTCNTKSNSIHCRNGHLKCWMGKQLLISPTGGGGQTHSSMHFLTQCLIKMQFLIWTKYVQNTCYEYISFFILHFSMHV